MSVADTGLEQAVQVRVTSEQHKMLVDAAEREGLALSNFMLREALKAAGTSARRRPSQAEVDEVILRAQEAMRRANPEGRSLVDELIAERRAAA